MKWTRLYGMRWDTDQEPGQHLVLEQPARLVLAQRREVGPPPGLAAGPGRPPRGLLARLLGRPVWARASWRVSEPRPASPRPLKEFLGSSPQGLEDEVHAARPPQPGGDGDSLDDLGVAGGLSDDDVGPRGQQPPVVAIRAC